MHQRNSFTDEEQTLLDQIETIILKNKTLTEREKVQCWVWVYSTILEGRIKNDELKLLLEHIHKNPHFFKDLIINLTEIHYLIKSKDQTQITRRLKESMQMIDALHTIDQ